MPSQQFLVNRTEWAVEITLDDLPAVGDLRCFSGVEVLAAGDRIWLRGAPPDQALATALSRLPCVARYRVDAEGRLIPRGRAVPVSRLPEGAWSPLHAWLRPEIGGTALPGVHPARSSVSLVRDREPREPVGLLTDRRTWRTYGEQAPAIRLQRWVFAVADDERVLVLGTPLPPLPGTELVGNGQILLPAGWWFAMPALGELMADILELPERHLALFDADGAWEAIPGDMLVEATRSAIRLSGEEQAP